MRVLVDTHVLLWWKAGGERLSTQAARELARADAVLVSPIVFWEVATLLVKGRIELDRELFEWIADVLGGEGVELAPLSAQAAADAGLLGNRGLAGDPADRLLYATARELSVPFVSKDATIRDFAREAKDVRVIW